jgi:hypothetical protein
MSNQTSRAIGKEYIDEIKKIDDAVANILSKLDVAPSSSTAWRRSRSDLSCSDFRIKMTQYVSTSMGNGVDGVSISTNISSGNLPS